MKPIIIIAGYSDAGKTTLIEKLVPELKKRGYRVGTVKNSHHELSVDRKGKDSWRHFTAGADAVVAASSETMMILRKRELPSDDPLTELEKYISDMDVIIVEGFKNARFPKIEIFRKATTSHPVFKADDNLIALVTDAEITMDVPVFGLEDILGLSDFIEKKYLKKPFGT